MKFIAEVKHYSGVVSTIYLHGDSEVAAQENFLERYSKMEILSITAMPQFEEPTKCKARTKKQIRNHHKARIIQVRNNLMSLTEDDKAILSDGERVQLARITCKINHLLAKWNLTNININLGLED